MEDDYIDDDKSMVLMTMKIKGDYRWHFEMDHMKYTNFPYEQEVLLTDGYMCLIENIESKKIRNQDYYEISFLKEKKYWSESLFNIIFIARKWTDIFVDIIIKIV